MRSISSSEVSQMLQKTVPVIMHTSSRLKLQCTGPMWNFSMLMPTVSSTNATEMVIRLLLEWKNCSTQFKSQPMRLPSAKDRMISMMGSTTTARTLT